MPIVEFEQASHDCVLIQWGRYRDRICYFFFCLQHVIEVDICNFKKVGDMTSKVLYYVTALKTEIVPGGYISFRHREKY